MVAADRSPSVSYTVVADAGLYSAGPVCSIVYTDKSIAACIESAYILVDIEHSVMISALAVFSFVIYRASFDLNFTDGEVSLEIRSVILGIPETEFHIAVQIYFFRF